MYDLIDRAFAAQQSAQALGVSMPPQMPILFFGDLAAYRASTVKVVTVAVNPSHAEFPDDDQLQRFPGWRPHVGKPLMPTVKDAYLEALSSYFSPAKTAYWRWFCHLEPVLTGFGASFRTGPAEQPNTALHTDFLSPVATKEKWSHKSNDKARSELVAKGAPLWEALISELRPQIALMSFGPSSREHLSFALPAAWKVVHKNQQPKRLYLFEHQTVTVPGRPGSAGPFPLDLVYGEIFKQPFGGNTKNAKEELGQKLRGKGKLANW